MNQQNLSRRRQLGSSSMRMIAAMAIFITGSSLAFAQSNNTEETGGKWSLGIGAAVVDKPYRNFDREVYPIPIFSYENKWISASIPTFDVKLLSTDSLSFRLRARWTGDGYKAKDSPNLNGMDERKASIWAGGAVIWKTELANVTGEVLADAMGNSKGTRAKLQIDRRFTAGKFGFTPRIAAEWVDDKYVDYYYGVKTPEVQTNRIFYEGKATTNMQIGLRMDYIPSSHHTVFLDVGATRFGSAVKDSPLVDKPNQSTFAIGYVYRF
ncbi:MipA/OmpV family protein [Pectobacterium brasiliense]|uniref:MipA/OmpV family protein n=1 Tax=Pectobacterium brasiliense TaxID=180957 RepID=UPI0032EE4BCC